METKLADQANLKYYEVFINNLMAGVEEMCYPDPSECNLDRNPNFTESMPNISRSVPTVQ